MQTVETIKHNESITILRLNRPQQRNAMSWQLMREFKEALRAIDADNRCRVVVLTGAGKSFCAGLDLMDQANPDSIKAIIGELPPGPRAAIRAQEFMSEMLLLMRRIQQPIIGAINGHAYGGGLGLALGCDVRIAGRSAKFCTQFIRIGVSGCDIGVSYTLPHLIGAARAHDMMITARVVDAELAEKWGLVTQLVDDEMVEASALQLAESMCNFSPYGLIATKQAMWANLNAASLEDAMQIENRNQVMAGLTGDVGEAAAAFFEGRRPDFQN